MPNLGVDGSLLWYDRRGTGSPVLFITGLGGNHTLYNHQVKALSDRYECIVFDHRGTGMSSIDPDWRTEERYTLARLATDALSILDTLDIPRVHLVGTSMGGMVAQLLALRHPERIRSLSLHSTWCRTRELARVRIETWIRLLDHLEMDMFLAHLAPWIWSDRTLTVNRDRIDAFRETQRRLGSQIEKDIYAYQCQATLDVTTVDDLGSIEMPTLVTAGEDDILVPPVESQVIHQTIPGSAFHVFPGCAHAPFIEAPNRFNQEQMRFLDSVEQAADAHS